MTQLKILSYNIHKGFSAGNLRFILRGIREALREKRPDLVFLQEVIGEHEGHRRRVPDWPETAQLDYLAEDTWSHTAYGRNAIYSGGHHGNAILSRFPIKSWENIDLPTERTEKRGLLHAWIDVPGLQVPLHAICAHLGLLEAERSTQLRRICERIDARVAPEEALILAGDFNDWKQRASLVFRRELALREAFQLTQKAHARTFPSWLPTLRLDRIYFRGLEIRFAKCLNDSSWTRLSDHIALFAEFRIAAMPLRGRS